jgi:hypothetical protein
MALKYTFLLLVLASKSYVGNRSTGDFADLYLDNPNISKNHEDPVHEWVNLARYPKGKWVNRSYAVSAGGTNLTPTIPLDYGATLTGTVHSGLDGTTNKTVYEFDLDNVPGARQNSTVMGESALPHDTTKIVGTSPGELEMSSYDYPAGTTIGGGAISIAKPMAGSDAATVCNSGCFATTITGAEAVLGYFVAGDVIWLLVATHTEDLNTPVAGEAGYPIVIKGQNMGDKTRIVGTWVFDEQWWLLEDLLRETWPTISATNIKMRRCLFGR